MPWRTVAEACGVAVGGVEDEFEHGADAPVVNSFLSSWMRMPRSAAMAAALMRLAVVPSPSGREDACNGGVADEIVLPVARRPV